MRSFTSSFIVSVLGISTSTVLAASSCSTSKLTPVLPAGETNVTIPSGEKATFVALGRGVQNYTCSAGVWGSVGAVASLFDASCIPSSLYPALPGIALAVPITEPRRMRSKSRRAATTSLTTSASIISAISAHGKIPSSCAPGYLGQHYFVEFNGALSPRFDFTASQRNTKDFVVAAKVGTTPSPTNATTNVAWLELNGLSGSLAKTVFRLDTAGGQPPSSCSTSGATLSVQYAAMYWFYS